MVKKPPSFKKPFQLQCSLLSAMTFRKMTKSINAISRRTINLNKSPNGTQQNDIHRNNTKENDTKQNYTMTQNGKKQNDTKQNDIK